MIRPRRLLLLACLAAPQAPAQTAPPVALRTAHPATAAAALELLGGKGPLPALQPGENWRITADQQGAVRAETDGSLVSALQLEIEDPARVDAFTRHWAALIARARGALAQAMRDAELEAEAPSPSREALLDALLELPQQVANLSVRLDGDLGDPWRDCNLQVWLRPVEGTWLEQFVETVKPIGLPTIFNVTPDSTMTLRLAVDLRDATAALAPLMRWATAAGASSPEEAARAAEAAAGLWRMLDGSGAVAWNLRTGSVVSVLGLGLNKPDELRRLHADPRFVGQVQGRHTTPEGFEVELTPAAIVGEATSLWKSVTRPPAELAKRLPDRFLQTEIVSYGGVAESYLLGTIGVAEEFVHALVARAIRHEFETNILPPMILAQLQVSPAGLLEGRGSGIDLEQLPDLASARLGTTGELLFLNLRVQ